MRANAAPRPALARSRSPRRTSALALLAGVALCLAWALVPAPAQADAVRVTFTTRVGTGQRPKVTLITQEPVDRLEVNLGTEGAAPITARFGTLPRGATKELTLPGEAGRRQYAGTISVSQGERDTEIPLSFEVVVAPLLQIKIDKAQVDVANRRLEARLSRAAAKASVQVFGQSGGEALAEAEQDLGGKPAGEALVITWPAPAREDEVARIDLRLYDVDGFYTGLSLFPWAVRIPHEEVNFATDSAAIGSGEAPKLEQSYGRVASALAKHRDLGPIKLYIAGHTDTVGGAAYNVTLSQKRAQAIAGWFRKRGLRIPIFFEGFGEHAPAVATADETDEPKNRRVDYILAIEDPPLKTVGYRASWKRLP